MRWKLDEQRRFQMFLPLAFKALLHKMKDWAGYRRLFIYGMKGVGKSHLLAAAALYFMREHALDASKPRVCFVPSIDQLGNLNSIIGIFLQTFCDSPDQLALISQHLQNPDLLSFLQLLKPLSQSLIFIIDQTNNITQLTEHDQHLVHNFLMGLGKCSADHFLVFAGSPNQTTVQLLTNKEDSTRKFVVVPFSLQEAKAWAHVQYPEVVQHWDPEQWILVEELTGLVFLSLNNIFNALSVSTCDEVFDEVFQTASASAFSEVNSSLVDFFSTKWPINTAPERIAAVKHLREICTSARPVLVSGSTLHQKIPWHDMVLARKEDFTSLLDVTLALGDHSAELTGRIKAMGIVEGWYASPASYLVRKVMMDFCLAELVQNNVDNARQQIAILTSSLKNSQNASMKGFFAEAAVLLSLRYIALPPLLKLWSRGTIFNPASTAYFFPNPFPRAHWLGYNSVSLQIPRMWNYADVDAILIAVDKVHSRIVVVGVQVTLSTPKSHAKSLKFATTNAWKSFVPFNADTVGFQSFPAMLWISPSDDLPTTDVPQFHLSLSEFLISKDQAAIRDTLPRAVVDISSWGSAASGADDGDEGGSDGIDAAPQESQKCPTAGCDGLGNLNPKRKTHRSANSCPKRK